MVNFHLEGRRLKILPIAFEDILSCFQGYNEMKEYYHPVIEGIPRGLHVESVEYDFRRQCFSLIVYHDSFPIVEYGAQIPVLDGYHHMHLERHTMANRVGEMLPETRNKLRKILERYDVEDSVHNGPNK